MQNIKKLKISNKMQPREYSRDGGLDDILHNGSIWQNPNDNRNVPYLNRNALKRNLNLNWIENDWNEIYRFVAVSNLLHSLSNMTGFPFGEICLYHPPSIFPISFNGSEIRIYFLLSSAFISQLT